MNKFLKFLALAVPFLGIGVYMSYQDYLKPEQQSFEGKVSYIEWMSNNHAMPLIEIHQDNGANVKFSNSRIILNSDELKIGDYISKPKNSKICEINHKSIPCIK